MLRYCHELEFVQIRDYEGTVRLCGKLRNCEIGKLSQSSMEEIYRSDYANQLRKMHTNGDFSLCDLDACPVLPRGIMKSIEVEEVPKVPPRLSISFEQVCNYNCVSCTVHNKMLANRKVDLEAAYDVIEEKLKDVLPHVKHISAHGCGELFVSKRILNILANWKPLSPKEEILVSLETNGSLFDARHWKQIENLGQYHLRVTITVMSFHERTYQILSGVKYPISQIENNLRFVKGLREQGIVNEFEIATVVQDRNFREMPEFTRRCIEEFGADTVRLRPYAPWGSQKPEIEWFMDVRNPDHPYYEEYREVMRDPIFKHPKVADWSGGMDTVNVRDFPYKNYKRFYLKERVSMDIERHTKDIIDNIRSATSAKEWILYGLGIVGRVFLRNCLPKDVKPLYILDKYSPCDQFEGIEVMRLENNAVEDNCDTPIILTPLINLDVIEKELREAGYYGKLIFMKDIIQDVTLRKML